MNNKIVKLLLIIFVLSFKVIWAQGTLAPKTEFEPITGAFGILLGERFDPAMVNKVIEEQPKSYLGLNKTKLQGSLILVEPKKTDESFQKYFINTTRDGLIFSIQAEYQFEVERAKGKKAGKIKNQKTIRTTCKNTAKTLANELEKRYGEPRGKGWNGEWYSFRQVSDSNDKKINLYANQCKTGLYRIIYTDEKTRKGVKSQQGQ